jgi:hypothetical protein
VNGEENPGRFLSDSCFMVSVKPTISQKKEISENSFSSLETEISYFKGKG